MLVWVDQLVCVYMQVQILLPNGSKLFFYFQTRITQHQHKINNIHSSQSRSITTVSKITPMSL